MRSARYHNLIDRLARIPGIGRECLGHVGSPSSDYPFYRVHSQGISRSDDRWGICLAAGVHGDEPAGVEAVVRFLEKKPNLDGIFLSAFPCLNPVGYDRGTRENGEGIDLNRQFHQSHPPPEVSWVCQAVSKDRYDLFICCHEDGEANGFYLYESTRGMRPGLGPSIVSAVRKVAPIDQRPTIDGRINHGGVIRPTNWRRRTTGWSMALYLYRLGIPHCLILETPTSFPFEERVGIHLKALDQVFASCLEKQSSSKERRQEKKASSLRKENNMKRAKRWMTQIILVLVLLSFPLVASAQMGKDGMGKSGMMGDGMMGGGMNRMGTLFKDLKIDRGKLGC